MKRRTVLLATALLLAAVVAIPAIASGTATDILNPDAYTCSQSAYINFEEYSNGTNLSDLGDISGVRFTPTGGYPWIAQVWNDEWPCCKYTPTNGYGYTSEGMAWAWLGTEQGEGRIDFVDGNASYFSLLTSNACPAYLDAYNARGKLLESLGPVPPNHLNGRMWELAISRPTADMAYVIFRCAALLFTVDGVCTDAPEPPPSRNPHQPIGDRIYLPAGDQTFPEDQAFHIRHGWQVAPGTYPVGLWGFELDVDGEPQQEDFVQRTVNKNTSPPIFTLHWVFNFSEGMTGEHTFTGRWFATCQYLVDNGSIPGPCADPDEVMLAVTRTVIVTFE